MIGAATSLASCATRVFRRATHSRPSLSRPLRARSTALSGFNPLLATGSPFTPGTIIGSRFFLSGAPIPLSTANSQGQLIAFRPLQSLQTVFPVTDKTTFNSFRLDHLITKEHHLSFRFGYNPSTITGIQVESQNQ